jgi:cyclic pyranopterin phosphate synthase
MSLAEPLLDSFGRVHTNLRVSVTDRCNIRCFYCMPNENVQFKPRKDLLTFEETERFVRIVAGMGVNKVRLTGGEPLVRHEVDQLVARLAAVPGIDDMAMTTNGILLDQYAQKLKDAGLRRLNISLDALSEETFQRIARREGLQRVLDGIFAAMRAGFDKIRLNAVAIKGITEAEVIPLGRFAREHDLELRFIEFMPLDAENHWESGHVLSGEAIRAMFEAEFGPLVFAHRPDPSQPAVDFTFADGGNRLRITAEGQVRNCLFSTAEWDARALMRGAAGDAEIAQLVRDCVAHKKPGHGIDSPEFIRPKRAMYQIGG